MKKYSIIIAIILIASIHGTTDSKTNDIWIKGDYSPISKIQPTNYTKHYRNIISPDFKNLQTTKFPGIYCQQTDDFGGKTKLRHFFYNTEKESLVEIPYLYYLDDLSQIGSYRHEYELYAVKTDKFIHKGREYKIPTIK